MVRNLMESLIKDRERGLEYDLIMENPIGSLRHRPYMNGENVTDLLERTPVDYCAFGKPYKKPTDIWTTFGYKPVGNTGNGRCNDGQCGHTKKSRHGKPKHIIGIACEKERRYV
jgi:hypothetical protein